VSSSADVLGKIKGSGKRAAQHAAYHPVVEVMARMGYGARGLIYFLMGVLSIQAALGAKDHAADQQGAIASIGSRPDGRILLWVILVGLISYSLWGFIRALFDPLRKGHDWKGILERIGYVVSGVAYAILVPPTFSILAGGTRSAHNGAQTEQTQQAVTRVLSLPWGRWMAAVLGLLVIGVGFIQIYRGIRLHFDQQIQPRSLSARQAKWVMQLGRYGTVARGGVFVLVGIFLLVAGYHANPSQAQGFDGALMALLHEPYGVWIMGVVALGLSALGIYSLFIAMWFRLKR
jgi:hypothetical protein